MTLQAPLDTAFKRARDGGGGGAWGATPFARLADPFFFGPDDGYRDARRRYTRQRRAAVEEHGLADVPVACAGGREGGTVVVTETGTVWMSDLVASGRDVDVQGRHT